MRIGLPFVLLLIAASPATARTLTIEQVLQRHEELDGKRVQVRGWIIECQMLGCPLYSTPDPDAKAVSLGGSRGFDRAVNRYYPDAIEVLVEGVVDRTCFDHSKDKGFDPESDITICVDRVGELERPRFIQIISTRRLPSREAN